MCNISYTTDHGLPITVSEALQDTPGGLCSEDITTIWRGTYVYYAVFKKLGKSTCLNFTEEKPFCIDNFML